MRHVLGETVTYEVVDQVAHLTLNRPERHNAFNPDLFRDLNAAVATFKADDTARVAVLDAAGDRAFSVGLDVVSAADNLDGDGPADGADFANDFFDDDLDGKPFIAAIHGHCVGQAVAVALFADLRIVSEDVRVLVPESKIGISALYLPQKLVDVIGLAHAQYLLLSGEPVGADWALRSGFAHEVVENGTQTQRALELAASMTLQGPLALGAHKQLLAATADKDRAEVQRMSKRFRAITATSDDFVEGKRAFIERRPPRFTAS